MALQLPPPSPTKLTHDDNYSDTDTASQRSVSLDSPPLSPRQSSTHSDADSAHRFLANPGAFLSADNRRESHTYTLDTDLSSEVDDASIYKQRMSITGETPNTSAPGSIYGDEPMTATKETIPIPPIPATVPISAPMPTTYPPTHPARDDTLSISSFTSTKSSRKARPESLLVVPPKGPLVLGIALVDFNHVVGPRIEWSKGDIFNDEEVAKILPFLALPDGAHLSSEDYSYFHLVPPGINTTTIFGISCNQQIAARSLLVKNADVTRSTVQKAVVVLASKPVFGPIREKLRVVTTALFQQRDFTDVSILDDFAVNLEPSLRGQLTESGLYMGTSLREFVHTFRHRTLILVKALILQKRIMFYGHPVERLCTYQYSLISLLPGLLQTLEDCGSPPLANRAPTLSHANSLKTSDHKSMMAFMGLPLDVFGKDAFFQPYLPLQQLDMIKDTPSWLCGSTNSIVTQQKEIDLLVDTEAGTIEFRDPKLERVAGLTPADRKWMDDIINDVNESWHDEDPSKASTLQFKGSDDYLRTKFEEYIAAALSSVKYKDFVLKGEASGVLITGGTGGDVSATDDFNPLWISEFKGTNAYTVWNRITDPVIFDIIEPRHPCIEKPSVVADLGIRLQEGIQELKLEQQLAPAREAVARTLTTGSTNFFKAVEGVKERWAQRQASSALAASQSDTSASTSPQLISKSELDGITTAAANQPSRPQSGLRPFSLLSSFASNQPSQAQVQAPDATLTPSPSTTTSQKIATPNLSSWSAGIGSFFSSKLARAKSSEDSVPQTQRSQNLPATPSTVTIVDIDKPLPPPVTTPLTPPQSPPTNERNSVPIFITSASVETIKGRESEWDRVSLPPVPPLPSSLHSLPSMTTPPVMSTESEKEKEKAKEVDVESEVDVKTKDDVDFESKPEAKVLYAKVLLTQVSTDKKDRKKGDVEEDEEAYAGIAL